MIFEIPALLDAAQLRQVRDLISKGSFVDGRHSAGAASQYQKNNLQGDPADPLIKQAQTIVQQCLEKHPKFRTLAVPRRVRPVTFNCYREGMYYHDHSDHSILPGSPPVRGDLSMTLFLSAPESYTGGELVIDSDGLNAVKLKRPAGHAVIYDACTMHRVNMVLTGERLGAVTSIESMISDAHARDMLGEVAQLTRWVQDQAPQSPEERRANKIYANLLRMWSQT